MFDSSSIIVGLEVGTSKICAMVGDVSDEGTLSIIGVGQSPSTGVRKGEIINPSAAEEAIRRAIADAESMADVTIRSVFLGVTGGHIRGFNNRGVHRIMSNDREVTEEDVQDVISNAKTINLPAQDHLIHAVRQLFTLDDQEGLPNPVGFLGDRLEVDMHVVHGNLKRLQNAIRVVKGLQLDVEDIVFTALAASLALLSLQQKEMGALVIDLGGGTTDYALYANGIVKHTGVVAVGGDHVTNDIAYGLSKVGIHVADKIKLRYGSAILEESVKGKTETLPADPGSQPCTVNIENLHRIMSLRLEETLQIIRQDLDNHGLLDYIRAGVFFCGGGAHIPGILALGEKVFGKPAHIGKISTISGLSAALDMPEFAAPVGIVKYGSFHQCKRTGKESLAKGIKSSIEQFFKRKPLL